MRRRNLPEVRHSESGNLPMRYRNRPEVRHCQSGELPMRPCGCDWDILVFGHQYCWTTINGWKHVICRCSTCPCHCHRKDS